MTRFRILGYVIAASLWAGCGGSNGNGDDAGGPDAGLPNGVTALTLKTPDGTFYTADVTVGSQVFAMDVDTGSTTTGVAEAQCSTCTGISPLYTPGTTATDKHTTAQTQYADGSGWSGEVYADTMGLGQGSPDVPVSFAAITSQNQFFYGGNDYQGILGLGPNELLESGTTSYFDQAMSAGETGVIAFEMCDATGGTMWVGGYDPSAVSEAPQYTPMLPIDGRSNPFYAIQLEDMGLGDTDFGLSPQAFQNPIVDTGTSLFYAPAAAITAIVNGVNAAPAYSSLFTGPLSSSGNGCITAKSGVTTAQVDAGLPPLTLKLPTGTGPTFKVSAPATRTYLYDMGGGQYCLAVADDGGQGSLMGDTILRGFVTIFDVAHHKMAFVPDTGCATAGSAKRAERTLPALQEHGHPPFRAR